MPKETRVVLVDKTEFSLSLSFWFCVCVCSFLLSLFIKFFICLSVVIFTTQVQPVAELVELSRRWAADGRQIRLNDVIAKGGTLRRTGSLRHRHTKVRTTTTTPTFLLPTTTTIFLSFSFGLGNFFLRCVESCVQ